MTVFSLIKILGSPSITVLFGDQGEGKTATGMKVLEEAHKKGLKCYIVGIPEAKWHLLPEYIIPVKHLNDVEDGAAVFVDESYLLAHARESSKISNKVLAKVLGLARQKDWTLVFATHSSMKLDKSVIAESTNQFFKRQSPMRVSFERKQLKTMATQAYYFFRKKKAQGKNTKAWGFIFSDRFSQGKVAVNYSLPTFWTEDISKAFSGVKLTEI